MFCCTQSIGRPKDALDLMNSQQLQYTKKMEKQRRRVHELEEKDAHMRSAIHQRKQFLAKVRRRLPPRLKTLARRAARREGHSRRETARGSL